MARSGEWLERALEDLCTKIESGWGLDKDMISGLVSYCELAQPQDAKEYLHNIIGQEMGQSVIDEYLRLRGHSDHFTKPPLDVPTSNLHAYVKPPSHEASFGGSKKPVKAPKTISISTKEMELKKVTSSSRVENQVSSSQSSSRKKKAAKVSLAEAAKGSIVFQQGKPCTCQARRHRLVSNCLSCGKIVCEQEGEGPCSFCGSLVLREGSTYAGMEEGFTPLSDAEAAAEAYAKRLVEYDRNSAARTSVIDDQSDYYQFEGNSWLSNEEKELLRKKQEMIEEAERAKRNKVVVTFDLVGRKVLMNEDDASEYESHNNILRPPDEREVNRIKPNPSLQIHPVFLDPGPRERSTKSRNSNNVVSKGICLEITGRVQHDTNELKNFMVEN